MAYTPITALPPAPVRTQAPTDFATTADTFVAALPTFRTEVNTAGAYFDTTAAAAATSATNAATSASAAATSATASATSATAAATSATSAATSATQAGTYAAAAQAAAGVPTLSGHALQFLRVNAGATGVEWADASPSLYAATKTSGYTVAVTDKATLINCSGTFTLAFTAVATLGNGWFCYLQNSGTGDVTLDPNGSETIDGMTSFIMYPGEVRLVYCTGSALLSFVEHPFFKEFSASGTFTKPPGYRLFEGLLWGAGSSGSAVNTTSATSLRYATGGLGGACAPFKYQSSALSATTTVTIGSGGSAVTATYNGSDATANGIEGGNSSFATTTGYGGGVSEHGLGGGVLVSGSGLFGKYTDNNANIRSPGGPIAQSRRNAVISTSDTDRSGTGNVFGGGWSCMSYTSTTPTALVGGDSVYGSAGYGSIKVDAAGVYGAHGATFFGGGVGGSAGCYGVGTLIPAGSTSYGGAGGSGAKASGATSATAVSGGQKGGGGGAAIVTSATTGSVATSGAGGNGFMQIWGVV